MSEQRGSPIAQGQGSNPAAANFVPGVPTNFNPVYFNDYSGGVNTLVSRVAVQDNQMAWCDGFMPLGPDSLRVIPNLDPNNPIYTVPSGTIVWYGFANIMTTFYAIVLRSDGGVDAANLDPLIPGSNILPFGTIQAAVLNMSGFRVSQWQGMYVLMVAPQTNGYWIWDGKNVYTAGTVGPIVTITDPGTDPALSQLVYIGIPQSSGSISPVAIAHVVFDDNGVSQVIIDSITATSIPQGSAVVVGFGPTGGGLSTAFGGAGINDGVIKSATLTNGGSGYTSIPSVSVSDPTGTGAVLTINGASGGILTSMQVVNGGINYTNPTVNITGGGGSNATAIVTIANGVITAAAPWSLGNGYAGTPTITFNSNTGSGAVGIPLVSGGQVVGVTITSGGTNYTSPTYYTVSDGNGPAAATADLMPFGVSGTAIEVYKSRVWISNGRAFVNNQQFSGRTLFSAADSPVDFGGDGGAFPATDSFTRIGYTNLIQVNGFLYLIADNSLNYISNIQTNSVGTPPIPVTTFSNLNTDPMTGSFWPSSVYVYGRNIVMSNRNGMYLSSGGAVTKVSEGLDGIWFTNGDLSLLGDFSGGVATIFGRDVYCMLLPLLNKITNNIENYLMMWDGRRCFTSHQSINLTFVASLSLYSRRIMYGTDGTKIYAMFAGASIGFTKTIQSKLYANPSYWSNKTGNELHGLVTVWSDPEPINVTVDSEAGLGTANAAITMNPIQPISVQGPIPIGQQGRLMGLTLTTTSGDIELNSMMIQERIETLNI